MRGSKLKIFIFIFLLIIMFVFQRILPGNSNLIHWYDNHVFYLLQSLRGQLTKVFPFSIGDIIYVLAGIWLTSTVCRWVYFISKYSVFGIRLLWSVFNAIITVLFCYVFFLIGWGANYYKKPVKEAWGMITNGDKLQKRQAIVVYDSFLVAKINEYAPLFKSSDIKHINACAVQLYSIYSNCKVKHSGLNVKPSLFGNYMERMDVEGYYNPFTGEGQVNSDLPDFLLPFCICHEMAHQAGVAAEGDANLVAYGICTFSHNPSFEYSAYLNLWLYTNARVNFFDSTQASKMHNQLNKLTLAHLDTLDQIDRKYHGTVADMSMVVYDNYLKMHDQHEGLRSYSNISAIAWELDKRKLANANDSIILIP